MSIDNYQERSGPPEWSRCIRLLNDEPLVQRFNCRSVFQEGRCHSPNQQRQFPNCLFDVFLRKLAVLTFAIYDSSGRLVWNQDLKKALNAEIPINLSAMAAGYYHLQTSTDSWSQVTPLIVK